MKKMLVKNNQLTVLFLVFTKFTACLVEATIPELQEEEVSITASDLETSIAENQAAGLSLGVESASDNDGPFSIYSIDTQNLEGAISIIFCTGEAKVNELVLFAFEINTSINASYVATVCTVISSAELTIEFTGVDGSTGEDGFATNWRMTNAENIEINVIET